MKQGEQLTMTPAEWRKADPDTKAVEGGQYWLLVRRDGETHLCPVVLVSQANTRRKIQTSEACGGRRKWRTSP